MSSRPGLISIVTATVIAIASAFFVTGTARADHSFAQAGGSAQIVAPGEGVEFLLGGVQEPGVIDPTVVFHLHLFFNEGAASTLPELVFSAGDVLRFTLGNTSIIYEFDSPSHILEPPFFTFGFFDANNIDDVFGNGDTIGLGFAAADVNGEKMTLEVLAGDGVRFSGLEFSDLDAGTFQQGGASTFVRKYAIDGGGEVTIDFDELALGEVVTNQYESEGVLFWGDVIYDEQYVVDRLGTGMDVIDARFLVNASATPPLGRSTFVGLSFDRNARALQFDYATTATELRVAGFEGPFAPETLRFVENFAPSPGPSLFLEGTARVVYEDGFDGVILPAKATLLLDHVDVSFPHITRIDFEGFDTSSRLYDQFEALGVHFFGDGIVNEQSVIDVYGVGYENLEGNFLVNDSPTPPGQSGMIGMSFDALVSRVSFDFSGPSPLQVVTFRGSFAPENIVEVVEFTTSLGSTGFFEGQVTLASAGGFDGFIIAESHDGVVIDNLVVEFSP